MADQDDDLAEAIKELTRTLEDVGEQLSASQSRAPLGGSAGGSLRPPLRPPTPRELLAFTDEVALPALLAALEASVRTLEAFQRGLRLVRTERDARDRTAQAAGVTADRASDLRRTTLDHLDTVLAELQRATAEGTLPADDRARELLEEARELRDDVDDRLRRATESGERPSRGAVSIDVQSGSPDQQSVGDVDDPDDGTVDADESAVDVDAELETLKDRYGDDAVDDSDGDDAGAEDESRTDSDRGDDDDPSFGDDERGSADDESDDSSDTNE